MRSALLITGLFCCLIGAEFLIVDRIVLHQFPARSAATAADSDDTPDPGPRVIKLPDSGGYVLVAMGVACLLYFVALRRQRDRRAHTHLPRG